MWAESGVMSNSADVCFYLLTVLISISSGIDNHSASIQVGIHRAQFVSLLYVLSVDFCGTDIHESQFYLGASCASVWWRLSVTG